MTIAAREGTLTCEARRLSPSQRLRRLGRGDQRLWRSHSGVRGCEKPASAGLATQILVVSPLGARIALEKCGPRLHSISLWHHCWPIRKKLLAAARDTADWAHNGAWRPPSGTGGHLDDFVPLSPLHLSHLLAHTLQSRPFTPHSCPSATARYILPTPPLVTPTSPGCIDHCPPWHQHSASTTPPATIGTPAGFRHLSC